jgi:hypothetical protein
MAKIRLKSLKWKLRVIGLFFICRFRKIFIFMVLILFLSLLKKIMSDLKDKFYKLISNSPESEKLLSFYDLFSSNIILKEGELIGNLSPIQKKELDVSYLESFDNSKLITLEEFKLGINNASKSKNHCKSSI